MPSVSGQEGQRVRRAEQGTNKGNQKPTKLFVRQQLAANRNFSYEGSIASDRDIHQKRQFYPNFRLLPTKIQKLPAAVLLSFTLNWEYSTANTVYFPPFMPFLVVLSQVSCKTFGYVKIHGSIQKQWNHWNFTNNCHKWLTQHNMNISTCGGWISRCGVMAWARFQTCLEKMRSLHYHFILNFTPAM